jgi:hypothetical protein
MKNQNLKNLKVNAGCHAELDSASRIRIGDPELNSG